MPYLNAVLAASVLMSTPIAFAFGQNSSGLQAPVPVWVDLPRPDDSRPLKHWVERLSHPESKVRKDSAVQLDFVAQEFEPDRLFLTADEGWINRRATFRREARPLLCKLVDAMKSGDEDVVAAASSVMMAMGLEASPAALELERLALDKDSPSMTRYVAINLLFYVTPECKPVLPVVLKLIASLPPDTFAASDSSDDISTANGSNKTLFTAGELQSFRIANSVIAHSIPLVKSGHTKVEVPYLIQIATGDYPPEWRAIAVGVLGMLEHDARSANEKLRAILNDSDENEVVRWSAAEAIISIEADRKLIPEIVRALDLKGEVRAGFERRADESFKSQEETLEFLREFPDELVQSYIQILRHGPGVFRRQMLRAFAIMGPVAKPAIPEIRKALSDADEETRQLAAKAIQQIEPVAPTPTEKCGRPGKNEA